VIGHNETFSNWTASYTGSAEAIVATNEAYTFTMKTNLTLKAHFIHNPWMEAQGYYNGLFTKTNLGGDLDYNISGHMYLKNMTNRTFAGTVQVDGQSFAVSGKWLVPGNVTILINRAKLGKPNLTLNLTNTFNTTAYVTNQIVGTVTDGTLTADALADLQPYNSGVSPYAGTYTMVFPGFEDSTNNPGGNGYGVLVVKDNGTALLAPANGGDNSLLKAAGVPMATVSKDGRLAFYSPAHAGKISAPTYTNSDVSMVNPVNLGAMIGWLTFTNNTDIGGNITWVKKNPTDTNLVAPLPAAPFATYYTNGFTNTLDVLAQRYVAPVVGSGIRMVDMTNALLTVSGGGLSGPQSQAIRILTNNMVKFLGAIDHGTNLIVLKPTNTALNNLVVTLIPALGKITGSFTNIAVNNGKLTSYNGAVLQGSKAAYGFFLGTNNISGAISILPDPANP